MTEKVHEGRNIKRIREILGFKQDALAAELGLSQQTISQMEQRETIDRDLLEKVAKVLNVPVEAIQNFDEKSALSIISSTFNDNSAVNYYCTFNPLDKWLEAMDENKNLVEENKKLYERLLQSEREKVELLQKMLGEKN